MYRYIKLQLMTGTAFYKNFVFIYLVQKNGRPFDW